jgi:acetyl-CoA carboxylase carboxyltransferase component
MGAKGATEIIFRGQNPVEKVLTSPLSVSKGAKDSLSHAKDSHSHLQEKEYSDLFCNPLEAARRGFIDDIIDPADTRKILCSELEVSAGLVWLPTLTPLLTRWLFACT